MDNRMSLLMSPFVPEGMVDLMKKLSKGVIKEQPSDIYKFAAEFFEKMLIERDGSLDKGYGKFRSYMEYCKFMDKMDQRRLSQSTKKGNEVTDKTDTANIPPEEVIQPSNIEVQGVAIQGVERKNKESVKNVSINPKYKSQSEKTAKPAVPSIKSVKTKPRKLSSKKPSENLIVIKEETSADVDDSTNDVNLHKAAMTIQKAFRMYMSKKSSQDENSSEKFGNVSQLSEDAAAVIIQKAFKSLIQKLKPVAQDPGKVVDESNNNIVIPGDGQENTMIVNKIINNSDEHSEQILVDHDETGAKYDLENKDTLQENALEGTAANSTIETNETLNVDMITTVEAAGTQEVETDENQIVESRFSSDEGNNQLAIASDNNHEIGCNEDLASLQKNEPLVTSVTIPLEAETDVDEIQEVTNTDKIALDELQLKEEAEEDRPVDGEVQSSTNRVEETPLESLQSSEIQIGNGSDDAAAHTLDQVEADVAFENNPNVIDNEETKTADETEHDVTQLNPLGTDSGVDQAITNANEGTGEQIITPESHSTASVDPSKNISNSSAQQDNDNIENSAIDNHPTTGEKNQESPVKQQLFTVEKDGIYVNMDLLQEKFGTTAIDTIDDGTGSDSEKSFKLNILEREEILVNQENVQQIEEEVTANINIVDKPFIVTGDDKEKIMEEVESAEASNCDIRDDEGNEEYELAETVVLMDIPSKSHIESESSVSATAPENECIDATKANKGNDEIDKFESCEKSLEKFSELGENVKLDDEEEVAETAADEDLIIKSVASVQQSKPELDDDSTQGHGTVEEAKMKTVDDQIVEQESTVSKSDVIAEDTNKSENEELDNSEVHTEKILMKEALEKEQTNDESEPDKNKSEVVEVEIKKLNAYELTSSQPEKVETIVGGEESKNGSDELNRNEVTTTESEAIEKVETVFENKEEDANDNNLEVGAPLSETIEKVEAVYEGNEANTVNVEAQPHLSDMLEEVATVVEVKEANNDNVEVQATAPEIIEKDETVLEDKEAKNENFEVQAPASEVIENIEDLVEVRDAEKKSAEVQKPSSEMIEKVEAVSEVREEENSEVQTSVSVISDKNEAVIEVKEVENENPEDHTPALETTDKVETVLEIKETKDESDVVQATDSEKNEKVEAVLDVTEANNKNLVIENSEADLVASNTINLEGEKTRNENIDNQLEKNELIASETENIVKVEAFEQIESEKGEDQLDSNGCHLKKLKASEIEEVKSNIEQPEDNTTSAQFELETDRQVITSRNLPNEMDEETNVESEEIDLSKKTENECVKTAISDQGTLNEENEQLIKAATIIQKVFRGYIVRNSSPNGKKNQSELWAAMIIQKYARGYLVRKSMQKINNSGPSPVASNAAESNVNQTEDNSITEVVPQLPAYSNRFLIPKDSFLERESFADDEDYARTCKELAATSIQKTYRGYRVRRSLRTSTENEAEPDSVYQEDENGHELNGGNDQVQTAVNEAERVISDVLNVAADVLPSDTYDLDSFEDEVPDEKNVDMKSADISSKPDVDHNSVLGQPVHDNIHVEGQMQQKYNQMKFQGSPINAIEEMSDSSEQPDTPPGKPAESSVINSKTIESDSLDSKDYEGSKSFSYEQLSSDLSDTEENKRESMKESEVDETSRDERDDLSEVENFDLSSCGEDSLEAMYYSLRKNEIMVDRMQKQVAEQREPKNSEVDGSAPEGLKVEFPERVTENLDVAMHQVFKSVESSSDYDVGKKDEDDNSSTLDLALDDSSSINDEREIETSRHILPTQAETLENNEQSESTADTHHTNEESPEQNIDRDGETSNTEQSQHSDSSVNSSTRFIMKSQSVSEDMMNPIMFAMKRKQALLDQLHVRPYPLQENLSEDHDAFPEHLLTDIDIGNIQRKIFASSVSETDSDYIEPTPNTAGRRLVRDDFNISTALDHLSTDSDSTIISAATKIQAGARGFLTRRRLRRSSAGGTSISFEKRYSFGNAAIDKSLEDLIKMQEQINLDGAALKIQQQYRRYQARKNNLKKVSPIREQTTLELSGGSSIEGNEGMDDVIGIREITLAQKKVDDYQDNKEDKIGSHPVTLNIDTVETVATVKRTPVNQRRLTLQRGDAVQRNSRPDSQDLCVKDGDPDNQTTEKCKDSETGEYIDTTNSKKKKKVTANINIQSLINRGIGPRQRSMPVQIDSELMRIIPKHLRKRVKSADMAKKRTG